MIYEVTLTQRYFDQLAINRWNYLSTGTPIGVTGSFALLTAMGLIDSAGVFPTGTIGEQLNGFQPVEVVWEGALCKAIREAPLDFYDYAYPAGTNGGNAGTDAASPALAYGFRTNRTRTDIRRATKRFVGVLEGGTNDGGVIDSATLTELEDLAALMSETLSYTDGGNSLTFAPIVVQKEEYTVPSSGKKAYRYYDTISEQMDHIMTGIVWTPYDRVRTQTSRQYGHGA